MRIGADYQRRVYAGVLGKMIGVYLGRPFENWRYRDILHKLGPITDYVHQRLGQPLIVPDDDLSGTFTFIRALEDHGLDATARQIGHTWLNYIIENKTILWWGGMGASTEHTAYLRLRAGIEAPRSGSIEMNSRVVAEQIGAQIFIDGWGMVCPGDPERAADFARRAAGVSHDGEAVHAAVVVAAIEAMAFVESDIGRLLDVVAGLIPPDCTIRRLIDTLRDYRAGHEDWQDAFVNVLEKSFGYDKFGGGCHVVPNHGVVILALLYGQDDFGKSLTVANTAGWDTDCNSGNVGCIMGIKNDLAGIDGGADWRGPVADRLLLPTADGGSCITDAAQQAGRIANLGRRLAGLPPVYPKEGARFHFELPGSVQGFVPDDSSDVHESTRVSNAGPGRDGQGALAIDFTGLEPGRCARVATATHDTFSRTGGYALHACPTLYPGQTVRTALAADGDLAAPLTVRLFLAHPGADGAPQRVYGPGTLLNPGQDWQPISWTIPDIGGHPIAQVGLEISAPGTATGRMRVRHLTWTGEPELLIRPPEAGGDDWLRAFVPAVDSLHQGATPDGAAELVTIQNRGRGLAIFGTRDWRNYSVQGTLTVHLGQAAGLAVRCQGLGRYYALLLTHPDTVQLVKARDDQRRVLAEAPLAWRWNDDPHALKLSVRDNRLIGAVDGKELFDVIDRENPLEDGALALVIDEGRAAWSPIRVGPT